MSQFAQVKVPQGKMLQLEKSETGFKITGDFFCYPEEIIGELEQALDSNCSQDDLRSIMEREEVMVAGFGADDLWNLFQQL